ARLPSSVFRLPSPVSRLPSPVSRLTLQHAPLHPRPVLRPALQLLRFRHRGEAERAFCPVRRESSEGMGHLGGASCLERLAHPGYGVLRWWYALPSWARAHRETARGGGPVSRHRLRGGNHTRGEPRRRGFKTSRFMARRGC